MFGNKVSNLGMKTSTEKEFKEKSKGYLKEAKEKPKPNCKGTVGKRTGF
jgi:hypothetical protein